MLKWPVWLWCGFLLFWSATIVFDHPLFEIPLEHPYDYIAHGITNIAGVFFFFVLFQESKITNYRFPFAIAMLIMIVASVWKEWYDGAVSVADLLADGIGMIYGIELISVFYRKFL